MQGLTVHRQETVVGYLLGQDVLENVDWLLGPGMFVDKLQPL
jgi:hypothetical protein